jgi:hypothetical protein
MKRLLLLAILFLSITFAFGQSFEVIGLQEAYKGNIGELIKAPIRFKNITERPITLIVRKVDDIIGSTQRNYFCLENNCLDQKVEDYIVRVEPGQTISNFQIALEAGLVPGVSTVKYLAFNKYNPSQALEFDVNFAVDEKTERPSIYTSRLISLRDVYPNPAADHAFVDYQILNDRIRATVRLHNILGNVIGEYLLPAAETLVRIKTDDLNAGIYFYSLYINNESVVTRKLLVKK